MKFGAEDFAPDGTGKLFLSGCYKDFAPNGAGRRAKEKGVENFAKQPHEKSQRDFIIQPGVARSGYAGWTMRQAGEKRWRATALRDAARGTMTAEKRAASRSAPVLWRFDRDGRWAEGDATPAGAAWCEIILARIGK